MNQTIKRVGRPSNHTEYIHVDYNNTKYIVGKVSFNNDYVYFLIDEEDYIKIKDISWHFVAGNYIGHSIFIENIKKELCLHNIIMGRFGFPGKGSKETVDHINRIGLDNRKENLKLSTSSEQRLNQTTRKRKIELPVESGLVADDIPKHIWYVKPNGSHGERFAIELNTENISWKTTSSKNISLKDKLQTAKEKLQEYYKLYPYLNPNNEEINNKLSYLSNSYYEIIKLSKNNI